MYKSIAIALIAIALAGDVNAGQPQGGDFVITKSTIDGGGGSSTGNDFVLTGTIGQPDANQQPSAGANFTVAGGFWARITQFFVELIFEDGFE